jgi:hypothetical protein
MAIRVPTASAIAEKWARVTPGRQTDYQNGVSGAAQAYQDGVNSAGDAYSQGVQAAIGNGSYQKGVMNKGAKYASKASQIGAGRWAQGVPAARSDYETGVQRPLAALASLTLPPRQAKGSPSNLQRVALVVDALRASKMGR